MIKEDSSLTDVNLQASICYLELHQPNEALKLIKKISQEDDCANYYEAVCYYKLEQFDQALKALDAVDSVSCEHKYSKEELKELINHASAHYKNTKGYVVRNFGTNINSENREYSAVMLNKFDSVLFTIRQTDIRDVVAEEGIGYETVYATSVDSNSDWSTPVKLNLETHSKRVHHATVQVISEGKELVLFRDGDLHLVEKVGNKWVMKEKLDAVNTEGNETHCFLTSDRNTIYFSSDHLSDDETLDLFVTTRSGDGTWTEPKPIDALNTPYDEDAPFISKDGTFYFSSRGHNSIGGFDIFKTRYNEETGVWDPIENLAFPINTVADDIYFNTFGKVAYLSSSRKEGVGMLDIYQVLLFNKIKIQGQVLSANDNLPVPGATIDVTYGPWFLQAYSDYQGNYEMYVPINNNMKITIYKDTVSVLEGNFIVKVSFGDRNHNEYNFIANLGSDEYGTPVSSTNIVDPSDTVTINLKIKNDYNKNDLIRNISDDMEQQWLDSLNVRYHTRYVQDSALLAQLKALEQMPLDSIMAKIHFDFNESELKDSAKLLLQKCATLLAAAEFEHLEIRGNTDAVGTDLYNQVLSIKRAEAVSQYLIEQGVPVDKMIVKGLGENDLLEHFEGRSAVNRRVDLILKLSIDALRARIFKEFYASVQKSGV